MPHPASDEWIRGEARWARRRLGYFPRDARNSLTLHPKAGVKFNNPVGFGVPRRTVYEKGDPRPAIPWPRLTAHVWTSHRKATLH